MHTIDTIEQLEAVYGTPGEASLVKEVSQIIPQYARFIEASPFCGFATVGPEGMDCSPRGDVPGFVKILDEHTLAMPDRRGNNRVDSLRNIIRDPRIALMFIIPGSNTCLRVNGEAVVSVDPKLKASFSVDGAEPRSVVVIKTKAIYFQCGRAIVRSKLWDAESQVDPKSLPTPGEVLKQLMQQPFDQEKYDSEWSGRAMKTLW